MAVAYLFVPAHEEQKVEKALASGADAVILDLEDSVPETEKGVAREAVQRLLTRGSGLPRGVEVWVRVNGVDPLGGVAGSPFEADLRALSWERVDGAVLPKAEDPAAVHELVRVGARQVLPLIESVAGLYALSDLASAPGVQRVAVGTWDLALDLGLLTVEDPDESELIWHVRARLVLESRLLGLKPPVDGVYARFSDDEGLKAACQRALRMGFAGKLLIHPRQVPVARSVFAPDPHALALAREVVAAYERALRYGHGAVQVHGQAVDRPMVERARALLAHWEGDTAR